MGRHLSWTAQAATYSAASVLLLLAGALLSVVALVLIGAAVLVWLALESLQATGRLPRAKLAVSPHRMPEGASAAVRVQAEHLGRDAQIRVPLERGLRLAEGSNHWVPQGSRDDHRFAAEALVRGPHDVGPVEVRSWSPGRLWANDTSLEERHTVEVVPRHEDMRNFSLTSKVLKPMQGRFSINRPGQGFDFFALRPYQSSDTIRDVNWKASARSEDLIVNQRLRETEGELLILLDARIIAGVGPVGQSPLDRGCRAALALFTEAIQSRDTVRFVFYGRSIERLERGGNAIETLERTLAALPAAGEVGLAATWREVRGDMRQSGPVVIISSLEGESEIHATVADLVGRAHPLTLLSPTPTGPTWEGDGDRQETRDAFLEEARDAGAMVVDWRTGDQVYAEAAMVQGWSG